MALKAAIIHVTPFEQNCTLLWDDEAKRATVVDPGGDVPEILAALERYGLTVEQILLTHGHLDHAGGAEELKARTGVRIIGPHLADRMLLDNIGKQAQAYGIEDLADAAPDQWLEEGDSVTIGGLPFDVLHCPGHSPGHVVFVNQAERAAIVGDVLFRGSIGRTDFPYGDHEQLLTAIRTKLYALPDDTKFLCGHGPGGTIGEEKRSNPFVRG
ncbi:MAG: MBL fold metallo-hydrolase [Acetobacteraceae bacterium]|nr:MBL fold metallo-hydrolase [Acetobacteraceae bacterium]